MAIHKFTIGEFSKLSGTTVKTLLYYEKIGILLPYEINEYTKYRYYTYTQSNRLMDIKNLKRVGFSMAEICDILKTDTHKPPIELVAEKIKQTELQLKELNQRKDELHAMYQEQSNEEFQQRVTIESIPEMIVACYRVQTRDRSAFREIYKHIIDPELNKLECKYVNPFYCYVIDRSEEYCHESVDIEYCEQVAEIKDESTIITFRTEPFIPKVACITVYGDYSKIHDEFAKLLTYIEHSSYKIIGSRRIQFVYGYENHIAQEKRKAIIRIPIE